MVGSRISWKKTLHLPKSQFPSRPILQDRLTYIKRCTDDLYAWQRIRDLPKTYILQDGPPYANGDLHIGHALNKILKDIICRSRLPDHCVDWRPGWDCHGLPIELKALQQQEDGVTQSALDTRVAARRLASKTVEKQKQSFRKWALMADWNNPWTTMDKSFTIKQLEVFKGMVKRGLIYRRFKPVYWSPSSQTALAEAELEYRDDHVSTAAFIKYPLCEAPVELTQRLGRDIEPVSAVIWTTTPWTIPANVAIAFHKYIEYVVAKSLRHGLLLIAASRLSEVEHQLNEVLNVILSMEGKDLANVAYHDPVFDSASSKRPFLPADFVSEASGSGLVHLAPGHGMDDYALCLRNEIAAYAPVDDKGCFTAGSPSSPIAFLQGKEVLTAGNEAVLERLSDAGQLLQQHQYTHNYPYDWRSRKPVIVRATQQWFADVGDIKGKALQALESVKFVPSKGRTRLEAFVKNRNEWCISRQRAWGVPIPALYHIDTGEALLTEESLHHLLSIFRERGFDAWWTDNELDPAWTPPSQRNKDGYTPYRRGKDTMDVWFDSGTSWTQTNSSSPEGNDHVADCYIEGTDQHRGWFQSSLLTHVATQDLGGRKNNVAAPFRSLITHGFILDQAGRKMSKSVGNVISPEEIMDGKLLPTTKRKLDGQWKDLHDAMGPDVLRLWVASSDYHTDVKVSQAVLQAVTGAYLKYRLTFKLMLGILQDFDPALSVSTDRLGMPHQIALRRLQAVTTKVEDMYDSYDFSKAVAHINNFINNDLSSAYFEWIKDAAYCGTLEERQQVHITLYQIYCHLQQMLIPITPLLVEEVWDYTPKQLKDYDPRPPAQRLRCRLQWDRSSFSRLEHDESHLMAVVAKIKSIQEVERTKKHLGDALQSYVCIQSDSLEVSSMFNRYSSEDLATLCGVSSIKIIRSVGESPDHTKAKWSSEGRLDLLGSEVLIHVYEPLLAKCVRCWKYTAPFPKDELEALCKRCDSIMSGSTDQETG